MVTQTTYGLTRHLDASFEDVLDQVKAALKTEGFGVLTEIDLQDTLKQKLQVDFRKYQIIGACNPPLAHKALQSELEVGLLLPCNVIVYEEDGGTTVTAFDPAAGMALAKNPALEAVGREAKERLTRALESL